MYISSTDGNIPQSPTTTAHIPNIDHHTPTPTGAEALHAPARQGGGGEGPAPEEGGQALHRHDGRPARVVPPVSARVVYIHIYVCIYYIYTI